MPATVFVSIVYSTDDPASVDDVISGISGLPSGATVNTSVTQQIDNATGVVDDDGAIVTIDALPAGEPTDG